MRLQNFSSGGDDRENSEKIRGALKGGGSSERREPTVRITRRATHQAGNTKAFSRILTSQRENHAELGGSLERTSMWVP